MNSFNLVYVFYGRGRPQDGSEDWAFILAVFFPIIYAVIYFTYKRFTTSAWDKGRFPADFEYTKDNLLQAYICLSAWMLRVDRQSSIEKIDYMNRYFRSHFGNRDFKESLNYAYKNPIEQKTITSWLNIHLKKEERSQLLHFLVGLSLIDGSINTNEKQLLNNVRSVISISQKELDSIIASYHQQRYRKRESSSTSNPTVSKKTALKLSCEIFGVSESAGMDEIKKAYRTLVKKHHPDRFAMHSIEQQKIAQIRFIEIQNAYEIVEKNK